MRRLVRSAAVPGVVVITLAAQVAATPAQAGPATQARPAAAKGAKSEAVYLVHGFQRDGHADCEVSWRYAKAELRKYGFRGKLVTWGYYRGNTKCSLVHNGTVNTRIKELGRRLAWDIYNRYSKRGKAVGILGHSMGGLVTAAAVAGVRQYGGRSRAWPPYLRVRNATTLSTPFKGLKSCKAAHKQCADLRAGSAFLRWLAARQNPQGRGGTDWTVIGAHSDTLVGPKSATGTRAKHKILYLSGQRITHYNVHHLGGGKRWKLTYSDNWGKNARRTTRGASPLRASAAALASTAK